MNTYVGEVPGGFTLAIWKHGVAGSRAGAGAGASLHSDHVKTRSSELVQDLDRVALGANRADLVA